MNRYLIVLSATVALLLSGCGTSINNLDANEIFTKSDPLFEWSGKVTNSDGTVPIAGLTVQVTYILDISDIEEPPAGSDDEPNTIRQVWNDETNAEGQYFIDYRWNKYAHYTVEVLDVQPRSPASFKEFTPVLKKNQTTDFKLSNLAAGTPLTWSGSVRDGSGTGVRDAIVTVHTQSNSTPPAPLAENFDVTDANGNYNISFYWDENYRYRITVRLNGTGSPQRDVDRGAIEEIDQVDNFEIVAPSTFKWRGQITRAGSASTPVAGAMVAVSAVQDGSVAATFGPRSTDSSGNYEIDAEWRPDWAYRIDVSGPGGGAVLATRTRGIITNPGSSGLTDNFEIQLEQSYLCSGSVTFDSLGNPAVPGAIVRLSAPASPDSPAAYEIVDITDSVGAYSLDFEWTPLRSYTIELTLPGESTPVETRLLGQIVGANRTENFVVEAAEQFHWRGSVKDPADAPQEGALITLTTSDAAGVVRQQTFTTEVDGLYDILFDWRPEYTYVISMSSSGDVVYSEIRQKGHVGMQDQEDDFILLSPPLLNWSGKIRNDQGVELAGATIVVSAVIPGGDTFRIETQSGPQPGGGDYSMDFPWDEDFDYSIGVKRPGQEHFAILLHKGTIAAENQHDDFQIPLGSSFEWSGVVRDLGGQSVSDATVTLTASQGGGTVFSASDTTAAGGAYSLQFVWQADFSYRISVRLQGEPADSVVVDHGEITARNRVEDFSVPTS